MGWEWVDYTCSWHYKEPKCVAPALNNYKFIQEASPFNTKHWFFFFFLKNGPSEDAKSNSRSHQSEILLKPRNVQLLNSVLAGFCLVSGAVFYQHGCDWQQTPANRGTACLPCSLQQSPAEETTLAAFCSTWEIYGFLLEVTLGNHVTQLTGKVLKYSLKLLERRKSSLLWRKTGEKWVMKCGKSGSE